MPRPRRSGCPGAFDGPRRHLKIVICFGLAEAKRRVVCLFDSLSERLQGIFKSLRGQGVLTEAQVDAALREIRLALLEADVHFRVTKQFLEQVRARAMGQEVLKSLTPDQAVIRIVRDEMIEVLGGGEPQPLATASTPPTVILMTGLQGSGKTTTSAKLGRWLAGRDRHPLLVSTDVQRPAAREQLRSVGEQAGVKVHHPAELSEPREILELGARRGARRRLRHDHRRHRRPAAHRRRADGRARGAARDRAADRGALRRRRDDRPGRGAQRRRVPQAIGVTGIVLTQARRRLARRRGALGGGRHRPAGEVRGRRARRSTRSSRSTRAHGRRASSASATCSG